MARLLECYAGHDSHRRTALGGCQVASEVLDILRRVNQLELPQGHPLYYPVNPLDVLLTTVALGALAAERIDHESSL